MMDKKIFPNKVQHNNLSDYGLNNLINCKYSGLFKVYTKSSTHLAEEYLTGLLQCEKGHENMERMVEKVNDSDYKRKRLRDTHTSVFSFDRFIGSTIRL